MIDLNNLPEDRLDRLERANTLMLARVDLLERELAEIKMVLRQPRDVVLRSQNPIDYIAVQEQNTGMRGTIPFSDPG